MCKCENVTMLKNVNGRKLWKIERVIYYPNNKLNRIVFFNCFGKTFDNIVDANNYFNSKKINGGNEK